MLISKEKNEGVRITFESEDNFNVHITKESKNFKLVEVYVTEIKEETYSTPEITKSLVEQLRRTPKEEIQWNHFWHQMPKTLFR